MHNKNMQRHVETTRMHFSQPIEFGSLLSFRISNLIGNDVHFDMMQHVRTGQYQIDVCYVEMAISSISTGKFYWKKKKNIFEITLINRDRNVILTFNKNDTPTSYTHTLIEMAIWFRHCDGKKTEQWRENKYKLFNYVVCRVTCHIRCVRRKKVQFWWFEKVIWFTCFWKCMCESVCVHYLRR